MSADREVVGEPTRPLGLAVPEFEHASLVDWLCPNPDCEEPGMIPNEADWPLTKAKCTNTECAVDTFRAIREVATDAE